nr:hypothetical protein [Chenggangzhangella methanolivorans]
MSSMMLRQRSWKSAPSSVSSNRRVVRVTRRMPRRLSSAPSRRLIAAGEVSSWRAAADRFPAATIAANRRMSLTSSVTGAASYGFASITHGAKLLVEPRAYSLARPKPK